MYMSAEDEHFEKDRSNVRDNRPQDIWGFGASLREALTGKNPDVFKEADLEALKAKTKDFAQLKDLLDKLLAPSREKRITAADALKHPWFGGHTSTGTATRTPGRKPSPQAEQSQFMKQYQDNVHKRAKESQQASH